MSKPTSRLHAWSVRRQLDGFGLFLVGLAALAAACAWVREIPYGAGSSPDSVAYISGARNLLAGKGFILFTSDFWAIWPPLFPIVLAGLGLFGSTPLAVAGPLNALAFGAIVFVTTQWLRRQGRSPFLVAWLGLALAVSPPLVLVATYVWSEPLFILLTVLGLIRLDRYLATGQRGPWLEAVLYAALACLTRYLGLALVIAAAGVLLGAQAPSLRRRAARALAFAGLAVMPLGLWLLRNVWVGGSLTDHYFYTVPERSWAVNVAAAFFTLAEWGVGRLDLQEVWLAWLLSVHTQYGLALRGGILGGGALLLGLLIWSSRLGYLRWRQPRTTELLVLFIGVYATLAIVGVTVQGVERINHRYLAPLYVPLACLGIRALDKAFPHWPKRIAWPRGPRAAHRTTLDARTGVLMAALGLGLGPHAFLYVHAFRTHWDHGRGLTTARWIESETLDYLKRHPLSGAVWSNETMALYLHTDLPGPYNRVRETLDRTLYVLTVDWANKEKYIVWFFDQGSGHNRRYPYTAHDLRSLPHVKRVAELADGFIWKFDPAYVNDYPRQVETRYEAIVARPPVVRSGFQMHLTAREVAYVKDPCRLDDRRPRFVLHAFPVDRADLPPQRQPFGFDNLDFHFERFGARIDGACLAVRRLPAYPVAQLVVGQYDLEQGTGLWVADIPGSDLDPGWVDRYRAAYPAVVSRVPAVRAAFDVYLTDNAVAYAKDPCRTEDAEPRFILHAFPVDAADLPSYRQPFGFDNLDFAFAQRGAYFEGKCLAQAPLPAYAVERLRVGQFDAGRILWHADFAPRTFALQAAYPDFASRAPLVQSVFNVYRYGRDMVYVKNPCRPEDARATFILHVFPVARWQLPLRRWAIGFDNRSVPFSTHGARWDGICLVHAPLPAYPIARVRVGQFDARAQRVLWQTEVPLAARRGEAAE